MINDSPVYEIMVLVVVIVMVASAFTIGRMYESWQIKDAIDCSMCICKAVLP